MTYIDYLDILHVQKNGWMSVPQFGGWDHKAPGATDYSMVFSRARANRKQHKTDLSDFKRASLGHETELIKWLFLVSQIDYVFLTWG